MASSDAEILNLFNSLNPQDLPVGIYLVRAEGKFLVASPTVRRLLGLPPEGPIQDSITDFYADSQQRNHLILELKNQIDKGWFLDKALVKFNTSHGEVYVEMSCKPLYNSQTNELVAYYGCLVDRTEEIISQEHELNLTNRIKDLTNDIGRVLHANSSTLTMVHLAIKPILELIAYEQALPASERIEILPEQETGLLDTATQRLSIAIHQLFDNSSTDQRQLALPQLRWDFLGKVIDDLDHYHEVVSIPEARPSFLRQLAIDIIKTHDEIKTGHLSRELLREVHRAALNLYKITAYIPVTRAYIAVTQMEQSLSTLRDYITSDIRPTEVLKQTSVRAVLDKAISSLNEFARSRGIEVIVKDHSQGAAFLMNERDFQRTFTNLLHNAIKYSWTRPGNRPPWVTIEIRNTENNLMISFENWGVPIPHDEIDSGLIFELGYRGRLSKDRNRLGTGIGLTDALQTIKNHNGMIQITSRPPNTTANKNENDPEFYNQPFITNVTITLPKRSVQIK